MDNRIFSLNDQTITVWHGCSIIMVIYNYISDTALAVNALRAGAPGVQIVLGDSDADVFNEIKDFLKEVEVDGESFVAKLKGRCVFVKRTAKVPK